MGDGRSQKGKSMLWSAIQIGLLVYAGLAALIYFKQDALVFQAAMERGYQATPARIGLRFDALTLATEDGETLDAWHVPARAGASAHGLVLVFHGNAGNISHRLDYLRMFHDLGYASLILDYRGYGRSSGKPSEDGTYLDAAAAWRHATQALGYPAGKIVLFGESHGRRRWRRNSLRCRSRRRWYWPRPSPRCRPSVPGFTPGCRFACSHASAMTRASAWQRSLRLCW
jgi:fermentation-respiration switch protein FrsA (DUF1100 family)